MEFKTDGRLRAGPADIGYIKGKNYIYAVACGLAGNISVCESVQNSSIGYFLGAHKYAPKLAMQGDMGWEPCKECWKSCTATC